MKPRHALSLKARHAICLDCGSVLHVLVTMASSRKMLQEGWTMRLLEGCADCGGRLSSVKLDGCTECAEMGAEWA